MKTKELTKNLMLSIAAQIVSLLAGFVFGFVVPKFVDEYQYSYWQGYLLYAGYVGLLHFGILDGLVLRYSRYNYDELDKNRMRSQFKMLLIIDGILCAIALIVAVCLSGSVARWTLGLIAISIVTKNIFTYTSYTFQFTNRINKYVFLVIIQKIAYSVFLIVLLTLNVQNFYWYCIADLFGDVAAIIIGFFLNEGMYFGKGLPIRETMWETRANLSAGILLLIANFSANFLIGGAKMVVQWRWDELIFGKVSFSFSTVNAFLTFVAAISVVLFPSLKRMDEKELPNVYKKIRSAVSILMIFALFIYFPFCKVLGYWLPKYKLSLIYVGILLPSIVYSSKVNLLTNNYLKAYRKEREMFLINVCSVVIEFLVCLLCAYVFENLDLLLYSVVFVCMLRAIVSEIAVGKLIKKSFLLDYIIEFVMTTAFIVCAQYFSLWKGCLVYFLLLFIYAIIYRKNFIAAFKAIKAKIKKQPKIEN